MSINQHTLPKGSTLRSGKYVYSIEEILGHGGFGITYLATATVRVENISIKAKFAIKEHFVSSDCEREPQTSHVVYSNPARQRVEDSRKDFIAEAHRLQKVGINHPNIVSVNEVFEANNTAYYVMEYLEGESLRAYVRKHGPLSESETLSIINPIIAAVKSLHEQRMTHLDIKPDNIMLAQEPNGSLRPVLIDFGLSKHYGKDGKPTSTINTLGCSDGYAPIEQYAGITTFSPEADFYALGATIWFCLTGKDPKKSTDLQPNELTNALPNGVSTSMKELVSSLTKPSKFDRQLIEGKAGSINMIKSRPVTNQTAATPVTTTMIGKGKSLSFGKLVTICVALAILSIGGVIALIPRHEKASEEVSVETETEILAKAEEALNKGEFSKGVELLKKISDNKEAQFYLGMCYENGYGVPQSYSDAASWIRKSAEQGYAQAQSYLGFYYENGLGVSKSDSDAVYWYRKAAEQGYGQAQCDLGRFYKNGYGVRRSESDAVYWYRKAADQGYERAIEELKVLGLWKE